MALTIRTFDPNVAEEQELADFHAMRVAMTAIDDPEDAVALHDRRGRALDRLLKIVRAAGQTGAQLVDDQRQPLDVAEEARSEPQGELLADVGAEQGRGRLLHLVEHGDQNEQHRRDDDHGAL